MTGDKCDVVIQRAMRQGAEGYEVCVSGAHCVCEVIADGLPIVSAMTLARQVRASLDSGYEAVAIRRDLGLENGEIPI